MANRLRRVARVIIDAALPVGSPGRIAVREVRSVFRIGLLESAAWFSADVLLVRGWFDGAEFPRAAWRTDTVTTDVPCRAITCARAERLGAETRTGKLLVLRVSRSLLGNGKLGICVHGGKLEISATALARLIVPLRKWANESLLASDVGARESLLSAVHDSASDLRRADPASFLAAFTELDSEPLPAASRRRDGALALELESVLAADDQTFVLEGWARGLSVARALTAVSPEGDRCELLATCFRVARDDLASAAGEGARDTALRGFVATVRLPAASVAGTGWSLELIAPEGRFSTRSSAQVVADPTVVREKLLALGLRMSPAAAAALCAALPDESAGRHALREVCSAFRLGVLDAAAWFSTGVLLVRGRFDEADPPRAAWRTGAVTTDVPCRAITCTRAERLGAETRTGKLLVLGISPSLVGGGKLEIDVRGGTLETSAAALGRMIVPLRQWADESSLTSDPAARESLLRAVHDSASDLRRADPASFLAAFAELDSAPPPGASRRKDGTLVLELESVLQADDQTFVLEGWARELSTARALTAVSPEGDRCELLATSFRFARDDLASAAGEGARDTSLRGFVATVQLPAASVATTGWSLEMIAPEGRFSTRSSAQVASDPTVVREKLLALGLRVPPAVAGALCERVLHPAFSALLPRHSAIVRVAREASYGPAPREPRVTAIVPLYGRTDFVEHQLAQYAWDASMRDVELIYVLDSPELEEELLDRAPLLFELYRVPFRVLVLNTNAGYSLANNAAAGYATGRYLLLLNSDVVPAAPGWISKLADALESARDVGAVGPKLVYEDGTIQHAGMYFAMSARETHWENHHYYKGLDRDFPAANIAREVPAVTGACLLLSSDVFREIGGFAATYVQGDFEDSDLCLRLRQRGQKIRYVPQVELYHLEGQSYPGPLRAATYRYNSWLHTRLWNGCISRIVAAAPKIERVDS